jgi:hypothetical protein
LGDGSYLTVTCAQTLDVEGHNRSRWPRVPILLVLGGQEIQSAPILVAVFDHTPRSIDPDPPQSRPVLVIAVDEQRGGRVRPQILEST